VKKEVYVFEVSEKSFDESVKQNSGQIPVVVEFMGVWSEPCIINADILTDLANEFASQFIFAKLDIDENTNLREEYAVENIPTTKVFVDGEVVASEEGQLTEDECRALLKSVGVYHESDEMRMQARELHLSGDTQAAFLKLTEAIKKDPQNTRIAMDMVQIFLDTRMLDNANELYNKLPDSVKETSMAKSLARQLAFANQAAKTEGVEALQARIAKDENDFDARFDLAICLIADYDTVAAVDQLFYILQRNAEFKEGAAKELIIAMVGILKEKEPVLAKEIQQKLSNLVAS
jgi:putative thioredoxin